MSIPQNPIQNNPNEAIPKGDSTKSRKAAPKGDKFMAELDSTKSVGKLKKHTQSLDAETDEDLGKIKEDPKEPVSLFDLSASKGKKKEPSLSFAQQDSPKDAAMKVQGVVLPVSGAQEEAISHTQVENAPGPDSVSKLQEVVEKIMQEVREIELKGQTDTIVTLDHPPMLKDATIVLSSFDSASKEFNITFENLTQQAKTFLDSNNHLDILKMQLEQKGYITHIIATTTTQESRPYIPGQTQTRGEERGQPRQQQQQGQQQQGREQG